VPRLTLIVTPHGFGHAARAAAVAAELGRRRPDLELEVRSAVPRWFFDASLEVPFRHLDERWDVGLVQRGPLAEDLPATLAALDRLWAGEAVERAAARLAAARPDLVVTDAAPLAVEAARRAGLPVVLIESFTWDWIYAGYLAAAPGFAPWIERLAPIPERADLRLRPEPACGDAGGDRRLPPIARAPKQRREEIRARLRVAPERALVLVSMGGVEGGHASLERCRELDGVDFVVPGGAASERRVGNVVLLPHRTPVAHPDLVAAADVVVGKLGYSTVAEAFAAGTRFAYLPRPAFRESAVLAQFVRARSPSLELDPVAFADGRWVEGLPALLGEPRPRPGDAGGAEAAADAIDALLPRR
jgi:UDP:flavonoid glycosyltransferase YjiC (YdhE family)